MAPDWIDAYLLALPGCTKDYKAEWEWQRYHVGGKRCSPPCCRAAVRSGIREPPASLSATRLVEQLRREHPDILPGFYADKRCWISIDLDGTVPEDLLRELCDHSYNLVFAKLTKKLQREISETPRA